MTRVLVIGMGRAGKSWMGSGLQLATDTAFVDEPDNQFLVPYAFGVKRRMGRGIYPALAHNDSAPDYEALWRFAFGDDSPRTATTGRVRASELLLQAGGGRLGRVLGNPRRVKSVVSNQGSRPIRLLLAEALAVPRAPDRPARHIVVGSAYAHLSAAWIAGRVGCTGVIVRRNLASLLATWIQQGWLISGSGLEEIDPQVIVTFSHEHGIPLPSQSAPALARTAWLFGFLTWHLRALSFQHPRWPVIDYEELVTHPGATFRALAERLDIDWPPSGTTAVGAARASLASRLLGLHPNLPQTALGLLRRTLEPFELQDWGLRNTTPTDR